MPNEKKRKKVAGAMASAILAAALTLATAATALAATDVTERFSDVKAGAWYASNVQWAYDSGYITGYTDGSGKWGVGDPVTRAQLAAMLARHAGADTSSKADATGISDLEKGGQWYTGAVNWAVSEGVITGYTDKDGKVTAFGPNDELTREQAATILARYAAKCGLDTSAPLSALNAFPDKGKIASWADDSVAWIVSEGVMSGYSAGAHEGWFGPADDVLREQMAKMLQGTVAIIEGEGAAEGGSGSASGGEGGDEGGADEPGTEPDDGEGGGEGAGSDGGGEASGGSPGSHDPYDLSSGAWAVRWRIPATWWSDFAGYGNVVMNSLSVPPITGSALDRCGFYPFDIDEDGAVTDHSSIFSSCDESVSYDPATRRYTVTYTPNERGAKKGLYNELVFTTPSVPYVNPVMYSQVNCLHCEHVAVDADGNMYATYLADSDDGLASDHFIAGNSSSPSLSLYLQRYGTGSASGYGEYRAEYEGRHVSDVWAECASKWREELEYFNCGNNDHEVSVFDPILIAPWNLQGKDLRCDKPWCENYQKADEPRLEPIHDSTNKVWASGN